MMRLVLGCLLLVACVEDTKESVLEDAAPDAGVADVALDMVDAPLDMAADAAPPEPDAAPVEPCAEEDELAPNQRAGEAASIEPGFDRDDLFACPDVSDWFALELAEGEVAKIDLVATPDRVDLDLRVVDAAGEELAGSFGETGTESVDFRAPAAGTYRVEVASYRGQTGRYSLNVRRGCRLDSACGAEVCDTLAEACVPDVQGECGGDDQEPNDRHDEAAPLDEGRRSGSVCVADRDWFVLDARDGDIWEITVSFTPGQNVDLWVLGPEGRLVDAALGDSTRNPERVTLSHTPAGRYLVGLYMPPEEGARAAEYDLLVTARRGECRLDRDCLSLGLPVCTDGLCHEAADGGVKPGDRCGRGADCNDDSTFCFQGDPGGHDNICTKECEDRDDCAGFGDASVCDRTFYGSVCTRPCQSDDDCSRYNRCDRDRGDCRFRGRCNRDEDCSGAEVCGDGLGFGGVCELPE